MGCGKEIRKNDGTNVETRGGSWEKLILIGKTMISKRRKLRKRIRKKNRR